MSVDLTQQVQALLSRPSKSDFEQIRPVFDLANAPREVVHGLSLTPANLLHSMHCARKEREKAESYRGFNVGAAVMGLRIRPGAFTFVTGHNIKDRPGEAAINIHAEQCALEKARQLDLQAVSMVVVVSETQPDQQSGHEMCTLHPCGLCRSALASNPMIDAETTLIASALPNFRTIELYSLAALRKFHEGSADAQITRFDLPALKMFEPVEATDKPIRIEDDASTNAEEAIWNNTVGAYLTKLRIELLKNSSAQSSLES